MLIRKYQYIANFSSEDKQYLKALLCLMGCSLIDAPFETDYQSSALYRNGLINVVISTDTDMLVYQFLC